MDHIMHQSIQTLIFKKAIKFLLSVSLFSFIFSYSSLLPLSFRLHSSAFTMQIFSPTIDKNYMFLLCNGILVLIFKNSGLISTSSPPKSDLSVEHAPIKKIQDHQQTVASKLPNAEDHEVEKQESGFIEEEDEDERIGVLSTEELNKKCEDFIKKMKEEIKFEAQQLIRKLCLSRSGFLFMQLLIFTLTVMSKR